MYVAGNAANGLGDQIGDRIFLNAVVVHRAGPLAYQSPFGGGGAAPGGWLELYGVGLPGAGATVTIAGIGAEIGYSGKSQINLRVPENAPLGLQMIEVSAPELPPVESPILIQESALTIFPASPPFRPGEPAELLGTGCGVREQTAELRIAHRGYPARIERRPDEPGLCRIGFQAPDLSPGRYPFHVCIAERCNGQRLEAIVVE